jgi:DNA-binding beta-propeller fold protein YncE
MGAAHDIATSPDGTRVFVTGEAFPEETADYGTVAYDAATGSQLWFAGYDSGAGDDSAAALAVSPDGSKIFVTGSAALPGSPGTSEYTTVA